MKKNKKGNGILGAKALFLLAMLAITLAAFTLGGCVTTAQPHSFVPDGSSDVAAITFRGVSFGSGGGSYYSSSSVSFFSYGDIVTEKKENWNPVSFPAGIPLQFTVKVNYQPAMGGIVGIARTFNGKQVEFNCPPLEAGKSYDLWSVSSDGPYGAGTHTLVLTEAMQEDFINGNGNALRLAVKIRDKLKVVSEQEFAK